ncbi:unnamed protein product, partial [Staurois parvus]
CRVSGRNSASSSCPIIAVSGGRNSAPSLVSVGGNSAPSLVSVGGGIVPHPWCQWGEE